MSLPEPKYLLWGAGLLTVMALSRSASAAVMRPAGSGFTSRDIDAMARTLLAETDMRGPVEERAGIVWVAVNRARHEGVTLAQATTPPGRPNWNGSQHFRDRWNAAGSSRLYPSAVQFVRDVLSGRIANPIGGRRYFVHPAAMPKPPCASNRYAASTPYGTRCLPKWSLTASTTQVGRARFS